MNVETIGVAFTRRNECRNADLVLDAGQDRILGVRLLFVAEIHPGVQAEIDAAGNDPEGDVRRHQAAVVEGHPAGLDRFEHELATVHVARAAAPAGEIRVGSAARLGGRTVEPVGVRLPALEQRVAQDHAGAVDHPAGDDDPLAPRALADRRDAEIDRIDSRIAERVGGTRPVKVDVRLIAATNEDLPSLAAQNKFRADLLDRLAFDVITLPPLRERREDIILLAEHFAIQMARELQLDCFAGFTSKAKETLLSYHWPGNVRELKNVVERSLYRLNSAQLPVSEIILNPFESPWRPSKKSSVTAAMTNGANAPVTASDAGVASASPEPSRFATDFNEPVDFKQVAQEFEIELLNQALQHCQFNQKKTAEALQLTYHQLRGYLKKYQLLEGTQSED